MIIQPVETCAKMNHNTTTDFVSCSAENELVLNFSGTRGRSCLTIVSSWKSGIQCSRLTDGIREKCDWSDNLVIPLHFLMNEPAAQAWVQTFPVELLIPLQEFEKIFSIHALAALWFLSRYSRAIDLLRTHPLLLALIFFRAKNEGWDTRKVVEILAFKRRLMLEACGFQGTQENVRLLKKMTFAHFGSRVFDILLQSQKLPNYCELGMLPFVDIELLKFFNNHKSFVTSTLFKSYSAKWPWQKFRDLRREIIVKAWIMGIQHVERKIMDCLDIVSLNRLHDQLEEELDVFEEGTLPFIEYPVPPLVGTDRIIPITNSDQLFLEWKTQQLDCVYSRHFDIVQGGYYVYMVLEPERATLGVHILPHNEIKIDQLTLQNNANPSENTRSVVLDWLAEDDRRMFRDATTIWFCPR
jgi:hypothetical protein